jgi:hypothetical protein
LTGDDMAAIPSVAQSAAAVHQRIELALRMIEFGGSVFPLVHDGKVPFIRKADGGEGFRDARPDPDMARTFLSSPGQLNYGVAFPTGSDIFVLDIDGGGNDARPGWHADWEELCERHGPSGPTYAVQTPSGGWHAYYRWRSDLYGPLPPGDKMLGWTVRKPWKGYVVGPGSVIAGRTYEPVGAEDIADFPERWSRAVLAEIATRTSSQAVLRSDLKGPGAIQRGHRHAYLRDQARHLVGLGLTGAALFAAIMALNHQMPEPKTADEVRRAIGEADTKFEPDALDPETGRREMGEETGLGMLTAPPDADFPAPPDPVAFDGLLGECVMDLAEGTDASLVGLLGSVMAFAGALVPGQAYFHRIQTSSPFIALVGESSIGRKGTAMLRALDAAADAIDGVFVNRVILDGLRSGEGLVSSLYYKRETFPHEPTVGLVFEEEYASLLTARTREGSTLDQTMRTAFDGGPLSNRRVGDTKSVTPPYWLPALVAVTPDELRRRLEAGALQSGSANRWLNLPVVRRPGESTNTVPRFASDRREALAAARRVALGSSGLLDVAPDVVRTLAAYADFLAGVCFGLARDLTKRMAVIAFRVALVHALVERSQLVTLVHLRRAIALTEYSRHGIPWAFGETIGNADAALLLRHLRQANRLTKHAITQEIIRDPIRRQAAIDELVRLGRATVEQIHGAGRPRTELVFRASSVAFDPFPLLRPESVESAIVPEMHGTSQRRARKVHETSTEGGPDLHGSRTEDANVPRRPVTPPATTTPRDGLTRDEWIDVPPPDRGASQTAPTLWDRPQ